MIRNASREQRTELQPIVEERRKSSDPTMRKYHVLLVDECPIDEAPGKPSAVQRVHSQEMPLTKRNFGHFDPESYLFQCISVLKKEHCQLDWPQTSASTVESM